MWNSPSATSVASHGIGRPVSASEGSKLSHRTLSQLPPSVSALLDGQQIEDKLDRTIQLVSAEDGGWPRVALLSVGEILASSPRELRLALYASSRTTQAVVASSRALLVLVHEETLFKIQAEVSTLGVSSDGDNRFFRAVVLAVDADEVAYATVRRGIGYELADKADAVARWKHTINTMRGLTE